MTPHTALLELLARVGAQNGTVLVSADELGQWPAAAVAAMKAQKLLSKAHPASSSVCPGCEQECVMPVQTVARPGGQADAFIVCDKRSDINRVAVASERLLQWRCDTAAVCGFVVASLGLRPSGQEPMAPGLVNIGMARGRQRSQMLALRVDGGLTLVAGNNSMAVLDLVDFQEGAYCVDADLVRQMVETATTADPRHTPSTAKREARKLDTQAMYASWQKTYRALRKRKPNMSDVWYSQQIATSETARGRNASTIKKHMKP